MNGEETHGTKYRTIKKCFQTTGIYPQDPVLEDDPFEGEELYDLQNLIDRFETPCTADEFIATEDEIEICSGLIDSSNPNWRDDVRQDLLCGDEEGELSIAAEHELAAEEENAEYDLDGKQPSIKTVREAIQSGDALRDFVQYNRHQELALAISRVNDLLRQIKLNRPEQQTQIKDCFSAV